MRWEIDASWPAELPDGWVLGQIGSVCTDAADNVWVFNRMDMTDEEADTCVNAPAVLAFDRAGTLLTAWGDVDEVPLKPHGIFVDHDGDVWLTGMNDGSIQKRDAEGNLLLQVGERGVLDSADGEITGTPNNSSTTQFFRPSGVTVDPTDGNVYVSDGYGNRRVVVLDADGNFLRQWGRQATADEARDGVGGVFSKVVHGVALSRDGRVYVCDRHGNRLQVFETDGTFVRNVWIPTGTGEYPDPRGTAWWLDFSPDVAQEHLFVMDGRNERVHVLDHVSGEAITSFGRPGHLIGSFTHGHTLAVDSESSVYVGETSTGRRIQKFRRVE